MARQGRNKSVSLHSRIETIWWGKGEPPLLLRVFEPIYRAISRREQQQRAANPTTPPLPLISVGNITAGGSGKTPFVIWLAHALKEAGYSPVILCRGDGGNSSAPTFVDRNSDPALVGDEARLLADASGCPVIASKDRITGAAMATGSGDIIILDDGFQYRHLGRNCDIVLIPGEGVGNGHLIPAGPLREPLESLVRADLIVRTGSQVELDGCRPLATQHEWRWQSESDGLVDIMDSGVEPPCTLHAVTAIARPERFFNSLVANGFELTARESFPDHHRFTKQEVEALLQHEHVAVTAKDAVKLVPLWPKERPLWLLKLKGSGEPGLLERIIQRLN